MVGNLVILCRGNSTFMRKPCNRSSLNKAQPRQQKKLNTFSLSCLYSFNKIMPVFLHYMKLQKQKSFMSCLDQVFALNKDYYYQAQQINVFVCLRVLIKIFFLQSLKETLCQIKCKKITLFSEWYITKTELFFFNFCWKISSCFRLND